MNGHFLTRKQTRWLWYALLIVPWLFLWFSQSVLGPSFTCISGFIAIVCSCIALTFIFMPPAPKKAVVVSPPSSPPLKAVTLQSVTHAETLPAIPQTAIEAYETMSPTDFEIFSAAVIIGKGEGHSFLAHSGKRGDRGVDARLRNAYGQLVIVQSKLYNPQRRIGPASLRELGGALRQHNAANGFFVTTATLTAEAIQAQWGNGFISVIDGPRLEHYLQEYHSQIAQALADIRQQMK